MKRATLKVLAVAAAAAAWGVLGTAPTVHAAGSGGTITCAPGTTVLYRAVGSPTAPMLVPAQVPATVCSRNGNVVAVTPSFQAVGSSTAPMIVPMNLGVTKCVPASIAATPVVGGGLMPALQLVQVGPGVFAVGSAAANGVAAVGTGFPVLNCF